MSYLQIFLFMDKIYIRSTWGLNVNTLFYRYDRRFQTELPLWLHFGSIDIKIPVTHGKFVV